MQKEWTKKNSICFFQNVLRILRNPFDCENTYLPASIKEVDPLGAQGEIYKKTA
jgi:hypothetical protein